MSLSQSLISIVVLLALGCSAASHNAAVMQAVRRHGNATTVGNLLNKTGEDIVKADNAAAADFVRRCQTVVTVRDGDFLPVKPLERFCATTDAAVECRIKVSERLKATHARDGDMGKFCSAVYDWFQGKYGMKCPEQCNKLQCKSTCMWLDAKTLLNKEDKAIQEANKQLQGKEAQKKKLADQVQAKEAEKSKQNFSNSVSKTNLDRASSTLKKAQTALTDATEKKDAADNATKRLAGKLAIVNKEIQNRAEKLENSTFGIEKAKLKLEGMSRNAQRFRAKETEMKLELDSLNKQVESLNTSIAEVAKLVQDKNEVREASVAKVEPLSMELRTLFGDVKKSCAMLKDFRVSGEDPAAANSTWTIANYKDNSRLCVEAGDYKRELGGKLVGPLIELVENKMKLAASKQGELDSVQRGIRAADQQLKEFRNTSKRYESQSTAARMEAADWKEKHTAAAQNASAIEAKIGAADLKVKADIKKKEALLTTQADQMKNKTRAENTLNAKRGHQQEEVELVNAKEAAVTEAKLGEMQKHAIHEAGKIKLQTLTKELGELQKQLKTAKIAVDQGSLTSRVQNYKNEAKELEKYKPEIVKLHGLRPEE